MIIVQVSFKVKNAMVEKFIECTWGNVRGSLKEAGITRFEFYRDAGTGNAFTLFEIYNSKEDQLKHRESSHYKNWKQNISDLLEEPYIVKQLEMMQESL